MMKKHVNSVRRDNIRVIGCGDDKYKLSKKILHTKGGNEMRRKG
jgi:hypothetical protein